MISVSLLNSTKDKRNNIFVFVLFFKLGCFSNLKFFEENMIHLETTMFTKTFFWITKMIIDKESAEISKIHWPNSLIFHFIQIEVFIRY